MLTDDRNERRDTQVGDAVQRAGYSEYHTHNGRHRSPDDRARGPGGNCPSERQSHKSAKLFDRNITGIKRDETREDVTTA